MQHLTPHGMPQPSTCTQLRGRGTGTTLPNSRRNLCFSGSHFCSLSNGSTCGANSQTATAAFKVWADLHGPRCLQTAMRPMHLLGVECVDSKADSLRHPWVQLHKQRCQQKAGSDAVPHPLRVDQSGGVRARWEAGPSQKASRKASAFIPNYSLMARMRRVLLM